MGIEDLFPLFPPITHAVSQTSMCYDELWTVLLFTFVTELLSLYWVLLLLLLLLLILAPVVVQSKAAESGVCDELCGIARRMESTRRECFIEDNKPGYIGNGLKHKGRNHFTRLHKVICPVVLKLCKVSLLLGVRL